MGSAYSVERFLFCCSGFDESRDLSSKVLSSISNIIDP
jgi:hypothetical protein